MGTVMTSLHRLSTGVSAFLSNQTLRKEDKEKCDMHKGDWVPLTSQELQALGKKDRYAYTIFKNMTGQSELLRYFVPDSVYKTKILPILNKPNHTAAGTGIDSIFSDKNYAELFMPGLTFPTAVLRRAGSIFYDASFHPISAAEALQRLDPYEKLVFKQTVETGHGTGIALVSRADYEKELFSFSEDYVVQEIVRQHPVLAYFNASSVNVLRITTLIHKAEVYVLGGILRIGAPGSFFDHGVYDGVHHLNVGVQSDGTLDAVAKDIDNCVSYDTVYGKSIQGRIPRYEEICAIVTNAHIRYPQYRIIGWDITLDDQENIICMEYNTKWPGLFGSQCCLGPVFAQKTRSGGRLLDELLQS